MIDVISILFNLLRLVLWLSMEKAMATHSSTLAWKIPWTEEPDRLQSMELLGVGHNWATSLSLLHALEKEMATHSSVLAWRIPGTGEPGGLLSMGLPRVGHDWSDLAAAACDLFVRLFLVHLKYSCALRASLVAQMVRNLPAMQETKFSPWIGKIPWKRKWQLTPVYHLDIFYFLFFFKSFK